MRVCDEGPCVFVVRDSVTGCVLQIPQHICSDGNRYMELNLFSGVVPTSKPGQMDPAFAWEMLFAVCARRTGCSAQYGVCGEGV